MNIITATQHMDINAYVKSDPRMPRTAASLPGTVRPAVEAPERRGGNGRYLRTIRDNTLKAGIFYTWPCDFTPVMRRIARKAHPPCDGFWMNCLSCLARMTIEPILFLRRGMGTPTFSSFNDVVRSLRTIWPPELCLYSGLNETAPTRQPAVRNGDLRTSNGTAEWWQNNQASLTGCSRVRHLPQSGTQRPPWKACLINKVFKVYCSLHC